MKTLLRFGLAVASFGLATLAGAQQSAPANDNNALPANGHPWMHARMAALADQLGLTDGQRASLKAIRQQTATAVKGVRTQTNLTEEQRRTQIAALRQSARTQMRAVLTPDQQAKFDTLRAQAPRRMRGMASRPERVHMLARQLALTDTQRDQIRSIRQATRASIEPIRANTSLTREQKRAEVHALLESARNQARAVLTPAQLQKLDAIRDRMLDRLMALG